MDLTRAGWRQRRPHAAMYVPERKQKIEGGKHFSKHVQGDEGRITMAAERAAPSGCSGRPPSYCSCHECI